MDRVELDDMGSGCEEEYCGLTLGFTEDCVNQECPVFGFIELVCVTIIYIPLMLFGLLGNILTILVVWLRPHMRSSTYLYLSSMAVSDLLILLLLPLDLYKLWRPSPWPFGDLACKLSVFLSECCTFCTVLHITFLSLERYLAVCWPITAKTLLTRRKTRALIGCLWLGAAISAAPVMVMEGIGGWREDRGWMDTVGEPERFIMGGSNRGGGPMSSVDGGLDVAKWDENETKVEDGGEHEGKKQNKMKEDEGGGMEDSYEGRPGGETDKRECRCLDYAATSGLLSAMTILSNLYFLIPVCILGLVYSLIGRTLWLRPQSSRKDQSHRHTVKMLAVIVLAFVLCWLPFHVGRTIFSLSVSASADTQETYLDANSQLDTDMLSSPVDRDVNTHTVREPVSHMQMMHDGCDTCTKSKIRHNTSINVDTHLGDTETENRTDTDTNTDDRSPDEHFYSYIISHSVGRHRSTDTSRRRLQPNRETQTAAHTGMQNDPTHTTQTDGFPDNPTQDNTSAAAHNKRNRTSTSKNSPNDTRTATRRPYTAGMYAVTPSNQYGHNTHNDVRFNHSHTHPDKHVVFYYFLSQYFNLVASVLFYLSAAINPLLYNLMSARYRNAVHGLIHTHSQTRSRRPRKTLTARHSTTTL
ncbi:hypothetical protein Q5P01_016760 [Channa striata]|uniref:G-protein coupled receptors family 1 profile domain-containing protein n=1 Tax=Channa striata TaxID=64152 RepID=A0AA88MC47_CHASR|nr:hypothetical protein Q5P01_016760 [Channa striata]